MPKLQLGVRWPEYDVPLEPGTIRAFLEAAQDLGFDHVTTADFLVVPNSPNTDRAISLKREEAFTLLSFMAGMGTNLSFMPTVITLPKRQTLLVAEQAATLARLNGGRFRLGVGIGDEEAEYRLMGADYPSRGERFEEQITVLRSLWSGSREEFQGRWHVLPPVVSDRNDESRPIPIWIAAGGHPAKRTLQRIGRLAEGIIPPWAPDELARDRLQVIEEATQAAGRDYRSLGIEPKISLRQGRSLKSQVGAKKNEDEIATEVAAWISLGATHLEFKTRRCGLAGLDDHIKAMGHFQSVVRTQS